MPAERRGGRVGAGALAIAAAATAVAGCTEELPDIETAAARAELDGLIVDNGSAVQLIDDCPIDDGDALLRQAFSIVADDRVEEALETGPYARLSPLDGTGLVVCGRGAEFGVAIGVGPGSTSVDGHVNALAERGVAFDAAVVERADHRAGKVARICRHYESEPTLDLCEVVWLTDELFVSAIVGGVDAGDVDLKDLEERFVPIVQLVVDGLAPPEP